MIQRSLILRGSVEVLVPWDLWRVELWEDRVDDDIQHELVRNLRPEVRRPWQSDGVEHQNNGHHKVVIKSKSLVANEQLLEVHWDCEPVIGVEEIPEGTELDGDPRVLWVTGLQVHSIYYIVCENECHVGLIDQHGKHLHPAKVHVRIDKANVVADDVAGHEEQPEGVPPNLSESVDSADLGIEHIPSSVDVVHAGHEAIFNWGCSDSRVEAPMLSCLYKECY